MRKRAVPESLWAPRPEQALPRQPYPARASGCCLSYGGFSTARGARLWLSTTSPSLPPQVAPQATPPARQPTSAKESSNDTANVSPPVHVLPLRRLNPRRTERNIYRCLLYLSSANVTRQRLVSAGLLVESLQMSASCAGLFFTSCGQDVVRRRRGSYVGGKIYISLC